MICRICKGNATLFGSVPFDRNNSGVPIVNDTMMDYYKCNSCDFVFCPEMLDWSVNKLGSEVYNSSYVAYDPDYENGTRAKNYAEFFNKNVAGFYRQKIRHLDYGSGTGDMVKAMGWKNSHTYDPFSSPNKPSGLFNLITAIEVFEHSQDIDKTIKDIKSMLSKDGVIVFSTQLVDSTWDINHWYIGARNGHIGILSAKSLKLLGKTNGLFFASVSPNVHVLQSTRNNANTLFGWKLTHG